MKYPVAEIFRSTQGEGLNSGRAMIFVRLAGCTVGKPYTSQEKNDKGLEIFQNRCTIYDGREFACDTDYRRVATMTISEILVEIESLGPCAWISLTGGEPLMHDVAPLVDVLARKYFVSVETSGTIPLTDDLRHTLLMFHHIVVSPKHPYIDDYTKYAKELRVLVDEHFDWTKLPKSIQELRDNDSRLWISPVNFVDVIDPANTARCVALQQKYPNVRISLQIHKFLQVR